MSKIRVLVVDDAVVFRRLVADELAMDPALEVAGVAQNGRVALAKLPQVNPDLVILDIEMPELDGLATLREIRKLHPKLPVIMFSALTERGAEATLDALALGATDYFTKPTSSSGPEASLKVIRDELIPAIKELGRRPITPPETISAAINGLQASTSDSRRVGHVEVVAIGTSTGGPTALADLFAGLPKKLPVPVVIVQHMPPMFTQLLAARLTNQFGIPVEEGKHGGLLRPGHVWLAPGDFHMTVAREGTQVRVELNQSLPENSCRPAVDALFRSVAQTFGPNALAVVLTGMGRDGLRGCELIREAGGQVIAQDEATSVVWGMPGFVARAGLAERVLPLALIAPEIVRRVRAGRADT